ncbi:hypothetical protein [Bradyrhizobium sp.]|uniref:hypothetical protein n=1 Tax=Bradyrhizobium sp. TaxID=376 RepID=UPI003C51F6E9
MSDFERLVPLIRRLPWLFIETPARAAGFLSVIALVVLLALRIELGQSWNLYASGRQAAKAGDDFPLLLQNAGSAFKDTGGQLVVLLGGSTVRELTADDVLVSKELTRQCRRDIHFVNLGSSSQTFVEGWDLAALAPSSRQRLLLVGLNPYRLSFDDDDVVADLSHSAAGLPTSFSLLWSVALHTGRVGSLERVVDSIARQQSLGATLRPLQLLVPDRPVKRPPAENPFQPERSSYHEPVWTRPEKLRQTSEYIATRVLDFHDRFRSSVTWFNRFVDHFTGPRSDVKFVVTPTDETFARADRLISADLREAIGLLGEDRVLDLRGRVKDLDTSDFFDVQHLVAKGREKLHPVFIDAVSRALGCSPGVAG